MLLCISLHISDKIHRYLLKVWVQAMVAPNFSIPSLYFRLTPCHDCILTFIKGWRIIWVEIHCIIMLFPKKNIKKYFPYLNDNKWSLLSRKSQKEEMVKYPDLETSKFISSWIWWDTFPWDPAVLKFPSYN